MRAVTTTTLSDRRDTSGREASSGALRRSRARDDLHLVDMSCARDQAAALNWRGLAEISAHQDGASSLRLRGQCEPRRQKEDFSRRY